jgi:hypothetical protein
MDIRMDGWMDGYCSLGCTIFTTLLKVLEQDLKQITHAARTEIRESWIRLGFDVVKGGQVALVDWEH